MSMAEKMLATMASNPVAVSTNPATEGHIVVDDGRIITVPESLKRLGVQYDHNIETVTIDCPRFWDNHDMSQMKIYINYMCANGVRGKHLTKNLQVNGERMTFDWTISGNVTQAKGRLSFLICIVTVNDAGLEELHWNSELNQDCYISEGLECEEIALVQYPDIITQLLTRMDLLEEDMAKVPETVRRCAEEWLEDHISDIPELKPSVQPDLAQNDPTQPDYVKNRTHWEEDTRTVVEWNGDTLGRRTVELFEGTYYKISDKCPTEDEVLSGIIEYSTGETLNVTKKMFYGFTDGAAKIGSHLYLINKPTVSEGNVLDIQAVGIYAPKSGESYIAKFTYGFIQVHTLDDKFIPDTIPRKADIPENVTSVQPDLAQSDPNAPDYVNNRTHWEEPDKVLFAWDGVTDGLPSVDAFGDGSYILYKISDLVPAKEDLDGATVVLSGGYNMSIEIDAITQVDGMYAAAMMYVVSALSVTDEDISIEFPSTGIYTIVGDGMYIERVITKGRIHPLAEHFIPPEILRVKDLPEQAKANHDENDPQSKDYIRNRTHWKEPGLVTLWGATELVLDEWNSKGNGSARGNPVDYRFEAGKRYNIVWNGTEYICECFSRRWSQPVGDGTLYYGTTYHLGNTALAATSIDTNLNPDAPFFIYRVELDNGVIGSGVDINSNALGTISLEIRGEGIVYHPLDERYIPDGIARKDDIPDATVIASPNGTKFRITVSDDGVLSATPVE